jgi:hypothetical protein
MIAKTMGATVMTAIIGCAALSSSARRRRFVIRMPCLSSRSASATLALVMTIAIDSASAQISDREQQALNEIQYEMTSCAAFNMFARQCVINRGQINDIEDAKAVQLATAAMERLLNNAQRIGRSIGMTGDAMTLRLNIKRKQ